MCLSADERRKNFKANYQQGRPDYRGENVSKFIRQTGHRIIREERFKLKTVFHAGGNVTQCRAEKILFGQFFRAPFAPSRAFRQKSERSENY